MFESNRTIQVFDEFVIPYHLSSQTEPPRVVSGLDERLVPWTWVIRDRADRASRALIWPSFNDGSASNDLVPPIACSLNDLRLFGQIFPDDRIERMLKAQGRWERSSAVLNIDGKRVASIWRDEAGNVLLPFDPDQVILNLRSEAYLHHQTLTPLGRAKHLAMRAYYWLRPAMPRHLQLRLRQAFSVIQARARFPRWPVESSLHDLHDFLVALIVDLAEEPVPYLAPWPNGYSWALVLTHDIETQVGYQHLSVTRDIEESLGLRSCWNFVPERDYVVDDHLVRALWETGHEVGVHGLHHDGHDLESREMLERRLPAIRRWADRWGAKGFRSPATHRNWELMPLLGVDYDSSYFDTDPFEPQSGGCCSLLPFWIDDLIELPMTLSMDSTLFLILRCHDESAWIAKAKEIRHRGGMALLNTHPDYLVQPEIATSYRRYLIWASSDATAWHALPGDVSAWWRRRTASRLVRSDATWIVAGPAADDGVVHFAGVKQPQLPYSSGA